MKVENGNMTGQVGAQRFHFGEGLSEGPGAGQRPRECNATPRRAKALGANERAHLRARKEAHKAGSIAIKENREDAELCWQVFLQKGRCLRAVANSSPWLSPLGVVT